jgi:hypothetical protein
MDAQDELKQKITMIKKQMEDLSKSIIEKYSKLLDCEYYYDRKSQEFEAICIILEEEAKHTNPRLFCYLCWLFC